MKKFAHISRRKSMYTIYNKSCNCYLTTKQIHQKPQGHYRINCKEYKLVDVHACVCTCVLFVLEIVDWQDLRKVINSHHLWYICKCYVFHIEELTGHMSVVLVSYYLMLC